MKESEVRGTAEKSRGNLIERVPAQVALDQEPVHRERLSAWQHCGHYHSEVLFLCKEQEELCSWLFGGRKAAADVGGHRARDVPKRAGRCLGAGDPQEAAR